MRKYARRYRLPLCIAGGFVALLIVIGVLAVRRILCYRDRSP